MPGRFMNEILDYDEPLVEDLYSLKVVTKRWKSFQTFLRDNKKKKEL